VPLSALAAALPLGWWHTPGHWSYSDRVVPATEFTVAPADVSEALGALAPYAEVMARDVSPTLLSPSLEASAHPAWTRLLTLGSDRLAHADWSAPEMLLRVEVAAVWAGLGGSAGRRTRGIGHQLRWLGATNPAPIDIAPAPPIAGSARRGWTASEEIPLELVARLAHLQASRVRAATGLDADAEVRALRSLLPTGFGQPDQDATG
jgi:hypothetical protein